MTGALVVRGGRVLTPGGWVEADVRIEEERVRAVGGDATNGVPVLDACGLLVAPGFVDIQINGGHGFDLVSNPGSMWSLARRLPQHGVTSFLPTIVSSPPTITAEAIRARAARPADFAGAEPVGLHFEGPMLNPERRGAHMARYLKEPSLQVVEGWSRENGVVLVTLAPELPGAVEVVTELTHRGVKVAVGHTQASGPELDAARRAGLSLVTHLFNAMAPLDHRDPGVVGTALADPGLVAGLIVDGIHVDPTVVRVAWNAKGPDGIALVTDAVAALGREPGRFELGGRELVLSNGAVRNVEGRLAGSALAMDQAVRNLVAFTGCDPADALRAASTTPAGAAGLATKGRIEAGADADLVLLDPALEVVATVVGGRVVYPA